MCFIDYQNLAAAALLALSAAVTCIGIAAAKNGSICLAPAAPGWMWAAAGFAAAAIPFVALLLVQVNDYWDCMGSPADCVKQFEELQSSLEWSITGLGIIFAACIAAATIAWIPFIGALPMIAIGVSLAIQADTILQWNARLADLASCAIEAGKPVEPVIDPGLRAILIGGVLIYSAVRVYDRRLKGIPWRWQKSK